MKRRQCTVMRVGGWGLGAGGWGLKAEEGASSGGVAQGAASCLAKTTTQPHRRVDRL